MTLPWSFSTACWISSKETRKNSFRVLTLFTRRSAKCWCSALSPLDAVLVHVEAPLLDTASGHKVPRTILSVLCTREELEKVNWDLVDASDLVERLEHRMKLTRGKGFVPVEPLGGIAQRR